MPELVIPVGENIGPGYVDWDEYEYVPGFTVDDIKMRLDWAGYEGQVVDGILLQFGICYGGSTRHAMDIHNYLRSLDLPVRAHVMSVTASSGTIVALAADEIELEHTAQWMVHRPLFSEGSQSQRSEDIRADADRLDREEQTMVDLYVARTGQTEEAVRQLISVDRFMTATEALAFGFATKVNPLTPKAPPAAAVQARLRTVRAAVARADKRAARPAGAPKTKAKTKAAKAAATPRPMAKKVTTAGAAVARRPAPAAAKPAALSAQQKANAAAVAALAKSLGVKAEIEGVEETTAEVVETVLADGAGSLFSNGELAEGSEVFNDQELTTATGDATYETEDGRDVVVAAGVVESITETEANTEGAAPAGTEAITAAVTAALAPMAKRLDDMEATFKKAVPPTPRPRASVQAPDGKNTPKPKAAHHAGL